MSTTVLPDGTTVYTQQSTQRTPANTAPVGIHFGTQPNNPDYGFDLVGYLVPGGIHVTSVSITCPPTENIQPSKFDTQPAIASVLDTDVAWDDITNLGNIVGMMTTLDGINDQVNAQYAAR